MEGNQLKLKISAENDLDPIIPYTDSLYHATNQYVTDPRANDQYIPTIYDPTLNNLFAFAVDKTHSDPNTPTNTPYYNLNHNI